MLRAFVVLLLTSSLPAGALAQTAGLDLDAPVAPARPARVVPPPAEAPLPVRGVTPTAAPYLPAPPPAALVFDPERARTASLLVERLREPEPLVALQTAERAAYSGVMLQGGDPELTRDLLRSASRIQHPDRQPGYTWAGAALAIGAGAGLGATLFAWFIDSFGGADDEAYIGGIIALGTTLATGLVLLLVGAIVNRWAPEQADFRRRQRDVRRALRTQYRQQRRELRDQLRVR